MWDIPIKKILVRSLHGEQNKAVPSVTEAGVGVRERKGNRLMKPFFEVAPTQHLINGCLILAQNSAQIAV